jgi:hypothetical protein
LPDHDFHSALDAVDCPVAIFLKDGTESLPFRRELLFAPPDQHQPLSFLLRRDCVTPREPAAAALAVFFDFGLVRF